MDETLSRPSGPLNLAFLVSKALIRVYNRQLQNRSQAAESLTDLALRSVLYSGLKRDSCMPRSPIQNHGGFDGQPMVRD